MSSINTASNPLLRMEGIHKWFGKVHALEGVDFQVNKAEAVGLVGDNGAGKSTLIKVSPRDARTLGVETVYQEQALAPHLSISRNIFMGREPSNALGFLAKKVMDQESMDALSSIGLKLRSPDIPVATLSGGELQGVAIARALHFEAKLVILDEPTIALSVKEVQEVLDFVRELKNKGIAVIFITHNLHHVYTVSDRIFVLAHGKKLTDISTKDTTVDELSKIIVRGTMGEKTLKEEGIE